MNQYQLQSYHFDLPDHLIAQYPHDPADQCKLMVVDTNTHTITHQIFDQALSNLGSDSVFFFNNSKVIKARIPIEINTKKAELFFLRHIGDGVSEFLVRPGKKCTVWTQLQIWPYRANIIQQTTHGRLIHIDGDIYTLLKKYGQMPLPPYISYTQDKSTLYQPIFADKAWSVASPTASLHMTHRLLDKLRFQGVSMEYVTLHVWIWTFKGVDVSNILDYQIHPESVEISIWLLEKIAQHVTNHKHLIAVGTTVCRTLESLPYLYLQIRDQVTDKLSSHSKHYRDTLTQDLVDPWYCLNPYIAWDTIFFQTKLYITPWFQTLIIQDLITNFHLPGSSLLILVASLMGYKLMVQAYQQAIQHDYQFYSFGDAMRIKRHPN
jgi:S-adenosylmethionine:tRNA ribosyltransferase-isomerase